MARFGPDVGTNISVLCPRGIVGPNVFSVGGPFTSRFCVYEDGVPLARALQLIQCLLPLSPSETAAINQVPYGLQVVWYYNRIVTRFTSPQNPSGVGVGGRAPRTAAPDPQFSLNIPGVSDIIKAPGLETEQLRKERIQRMKSSKPLLPAPLQWIPPLLNKLDDAQDLLFTGLALAWPLLRLAPRFLLGPLGWLLTANDLLNVFT